MTRTGHLPVIKKSTAVCFRDVVNHLSSASAETRWGPEMARSQHSLEAFSKAVEAIYDCALNPDGWRQALRLIGCLTDSPDVAVAIVDYTQRRVAYDAYVGFDQAYMKVFHDKFAVNPLFSIGHLRPAGEVYTLANITSQTFVDSEFYHDWVKPQGCGDLIAVNAKRANSRVGGLSCNRKITQPSYGNTDFDLFRLLAPHVCRTLAISDALDLKSVGSDALEATLDALTSLVYLTDRDARVVYMNRAAEQHIKTGNSLRILNNRLSATSHIEHAALKRAIAEAVADESAAPTGGVSLALPNSDGAGLVATILPLNRGERRSVAGIAATAAIFVQDPLVETLYPGEAFAKLYDLTGAELRVLLAMAPGLSVKEAAQMLGIGEVTARTHLQHIFSKTGTSKQTELLNLLKNSTAPVHLSNPTAPKG
jgi:DNA-binding CsgD family transcriptional regulator